jgi:hypothetical protein
MASSCVWCGDKIGNIFFACTKNTHGKTCYDDHPSECDAYYNTWGRTPYPPSPGWVPLCNQGFIAPAPTTQPVVASTPLNSCLYCGGATTALFCSTNCKIITNNNFPNKLNSPIVPFPAPVNWFPLMSFDAKPLWVELNGCRFKRARDPSGHACFNCGDEVEANRKVLTVCDECDLNGGGNGYLYNMIQHAKTPAGWPSQAFPVQYINSLWGHDPKSPSGILNFYPNNVIASLTTSGNILMGPTKVKVKAPEPPKNIVKAKAYEKCTKCSIELSPELDQYYGRDTVWGKTCSPCRKKAGVRQ